MNTVERQTHSSEAGFQCALLDQDYRKEVVGCDVHGIRGSSVDGHGTAKRYQDPFYQRERKQRAGVGLLGLGEDSGSDSVPDR